MKDTFIPGHLMADENGNQAMNSLKLDVAHLGHGENLYSLRNL